MFYRLIENLRCPDDGNFPMQINVIKIKKLNQFKSKNIRSQIPHCSLLCGRKMQFINNLKKLPECEECYSDYILEGYFTCNKCKRRYPIVKGIPNILPSNLANLKNSVINHKFITHKISPNEVISNEIKREEMAHHNETAIDYDDWWVNHPRSQIFYKRAVKIWKNNLSESNKSIIDIGCGSGKCSILMAKYGYLIGLDISLKMIEILQKKVFKNGFIVDCVVGDAENLPFYDNCAKSATFWGVAHHLPNRIIAYKSVKRVIEKGGNLLISEPNIKRSYIPFAIGKIINFPYYIIRSFLNLIRSKKLEASKTHITKNEVLLNLNIEKKILNDLGFDIIYSKTRWFFGIIPILWLPKKILFLIYKLFMYFDIVIEKNILKEKGGELCIIANLINK